jgi:DNA-binding protein H-NS
MPSYEELKAKLAALQQEVDAQLAVERKEGIERCLSIINMYGLTAYDLGLVKTQVIAAKKAPSEGMFARKKVKTTKPPKYRDPATGATWSGYGHQPRWIDGNKDDYLIENQKESNQRGKKAA